MTGSYPKMLYKQGDQAEVFDEKLKVDTLIVNDEAEFAEAIGDGWHETPGDRQAGLSGRRRPADRRRRLPG